MAIDTPEKRKSVIDFTRTTGTGIPLPTGSILEPSRAHMLNLYSGLLPNISPFFFWRNKNRLTTFWRNCKTPGDGSTQII